MCCCFPRKTTHIQYHHRPSSTLTPLQPCSSRHHSCHRVLLPRHHQRQHCINSHSCVGSAETVAMSLAFDEFGRPYIIIKVGTRLVVHQISQQFAMMLHHRSRTRSRGSRDWLHKKPTSPQPKQWRAFCARPWAQKAWTRCCSRLMATSPSVRVACA